MMVEKRFKINQACKVLGISAQTIRNYEKSGIFPPSKKDGKGWRYYTEDDITKLKAYFLPNKEKK